MFVFSFCFLFTVPHSSHRNELILLKSVKAAFWCVNIDFDKNLYQKRNHTHHSRFIDHRDYSSHNGHGSRRRISAHTHRRTRNAFVFYVFFLRYSEARARHRDLVNCSFRCVQHTAFVSNTPRMKIRHSQSVKEQRTSKIQTEMNKNGIYCGSHQRRHKEVSTHGPECMYGSTTSLRAQVLQMDRGGQL